MEKFADLINAVTWFIALPEVRHRVRIAKEEADGEWEPAIHLNGFTSEAKEAADALYAKLDAMRDEKTGIISAADRDTFNHVVKEFKIEMEEDHENGDVFEYLQMNDYRIGF